LDDVNVTLAKMDERGQRPAALLYDFSLLVPGLYIAPPEYVRGLWSSIRRAGGVIIADEVQCGLGRNGTTLWGFDGAVGGGDNSTITMRPIPDIVTIGKPLGNGQPLGAVITTPKIAGRLSTGYFSTYGGNPVSCAAGVAVLDVVRDEKLVASAGSVGRLLAQLLSTLKQKYPTLIGDVRGCGLMWAVELEAAAAAGESARTFKAATTELARHVMNGMRQKKVLVALTGAKRNILLLTPPMCFNLQNARV